MLQNFEPFIILGRYDIFVASNSIFQHKLYNVGYEILTFKVFAVDFLRPLSIFTLVFSGFTSSILLAGLGLNS